MPPVAQILEQLSPQLERHDDRPVAVMMCGMCGSGKSTLTYALLSAYPQFTRVSIDAIVHERYGLYGIDYEPALHEGYTDQACEVFEQRLRDLLAAGRDVVLDRAFYAREDREEFRGLVEGLGARCVLVVLRAADKEVLWERVRGRNQRRGSLGKREGDAAFEITRDVFEGWWEGFEWPDGEGEVTIDVD